MAVDTTEMRPGAEANFYSKQTGRSHIILMNGFHLSGQIKTVTEEAVAFIDEHDGVEKLVYKHAISTVSPLGQSTTKRPGYDLPKTLPDFEKMK